MMRKISCGRAAAAAMCAIAIAAPASATADNVVEVGDACFDKDTLSFVDCPIEETPIAPVTYDWTGFYAGGHVGAAFGDIETTSVAPGIVAGDTLAAFDGDFAAAAGGFQAGAQIELNRVLLGVEGAITVFGGDDASDAPFLGGVSETRSEVAHLITLVGRLGYTFDRWLAYAKGGYANAVVNVDQTLDGVAIAGSSGREGGFVVGGGVEYFLTPGVSLGLDYAFTRISTEDRLGVGVGPTAIDFSEVDVDIHTVSLRGNIHF